MSMPQLEIWPAGHCYQFCKFLGFGG